MGSRGASTKRAWTDEELMALPDDGKVEALSPSDGPADVARKVGEYLAVGVRLLWVVDPDKRNAVVYRPGATPRTVRQDGALDGEDVLPGFSCPMSALFP